MNRVDCQHKWVPLSFAFETQLLDDRGRVLVRQPEIKNGRVYCVCMKCYSHSYAETEWIGYSIHLKTEEKEPTT